MQIYCKNCGFILDEKKQVCDYCGINIESSTISNSTVIEKKQTKSNSEDVLIPLILLVLLPGLHYFYKRKFFSGFVRCILFWITFGGFGLWFFIDLIRIILGKFTIEREK